MQHHSSLSRLLSVKVTVKIPFSILRRFAVDCHSRFKGLSNKRSIRQKRSHTSMNRALKQLILYSLFFIILSPESERHPFQELSRSFAFRQRTREIVNFHYIVISSFIIVNNTTFLPFVFIIVVSVC